MAWVTKVGKYEEFSQSNWWAIVDLRVIEAGVKEETENWVETTVKNTLNVDYDTELWTH